MINEVFDLATEVAIDGSLSVLNHCQFPFTAYAGNRLSSYGLHCI